jgi:hypothetical protein
MNPESLIREDVDRDHCVPVKLSDGNTWLLPKPWISLRPAFRAGKAIAAFSGLTYGPELDGLIVAIKEAEDFVDQILATMSLGAFLVRRNYDLDDRQLESLFVYRSDDPESEEMIRVIIETATGTGGPKVGSGG